MSPPFPASERMVDATTKQITTWSFNEDGKKVKSVRTYKIEKKLVSKSIARRKALPKFGMSKNDRAGPNPATTIVAEDITMQFIANKDECDKEEGEKSALDILKAQSKGVVKCRICKEDHWTTNCPYKDTLGPLRDSLAGKEGGDEDEKDAGGAPGGAPQGGGSVGPGGKYVPPSRRGGEGSGARDRIGESMPDRRRTEDTAAIRVSNLSENTQETDLSDLFKPFGHIARIFLARDKITGQCKGFAFINYIRKEDAAKAIATLNKYGYDNLILNVEWAKPSGT